MNKLLVILGPTATGKTDLALHLAKQLGGELVACDSRQIYQGLDIGTGKLPDKKVFVKKGKGFWEINGIKVWMYDVVSPKKQYTVFDYVQDANKIIQDIIIRDKLPIIVGGTGLYLKALLDGLPNLGIPVDHQLRNVLEKLSLSQLQNKLQNLNPKRWSEMNKSDRNNPRRLVRAIEIANAVDKNATAVAKLDQTNVLKIGLTAKRKVLYGRINRRILTRINQGMIDEARRLNNSGLSIKRMKELGLEYGVLADYLEGKISNIAELIKILKGKIHGYARRQLTWFKKEKDIHWFDITTSDYQKRIEKLISQWYD